MHRRQVLIGAAALVVCPVRPARAGEVKSFDAKSFAAAQEAGESTVVFVHAPW